MRPPIFDSSPGGSVLRALLCCLVGRVGSRAASFQEQLLDERSWFLARDPRALQGGAKAPDTDHGRHAISAASDLSHSNTRGEAFWLFLSQFGW
jgi:hypothetical protein